MIKGLPREILIFVTLVFVQVFIFNNIQISGFINPYIYILFILILPFSVPGWLLLLASFLLGLTIDIFSQSLGMHAFACVFMAGFRPLVLNITSPREGYATNTSPSIREYGLAWFLRYAIILIFLHHVTLFFLEVFTFHGFFRTLLRVIFSVTFTVIIVLIEQYLFERE